MNESVSWTKGQFRQMEAQESTHGQTSVSTSAAYTDVFTYKTWETFTKAFSQESLTSWVSFALRILTT